MRLDPASLRLRIVPLSRLRLHEDFDPWRARRLEVSLRHQHILKNPVIVVEAGEVYIVLDGATRVTALTELGLPHILVQVV
ncbi:MAG TPA: ParB N-terminal domain-containing protein, partial [Anaerolineales bacterium]|nr:ParB N-terminal domain-containing protein [Anaerolineales bacterium]